MTGNGCLSSNASIILAPRIEEQILSCLFAVKDSSVTARSMGLTEEDFSFSVNKMTYKLLKSYWDKRVGFDYIIFTEEARSLGYLDACGGEERVESLALFPSAECSVDKLEEYITELRFNRSFRYKTHLLLQKYASTILDLGHSAEDVVEGLSREISILREEFRRQDDRHKLQRVSQIIEDIAVEIQAVEAGTKLRPVSTGWPEVDQALATGGLSNELIILMSRPGMGKTSLAVTLATNIGERGEVVAYLSCEDPKEELVSRMLINVSDGQVDRYAMNNGMTERQWDGFWGVHGLNLPIFITDAPASKWSIEWIEEQLHSVKNRIGVFPRILFLDYLNLWVTLQGGGKEESSNRRFYDKTLAELQNLTKKYNIAIVAICQFNRGAESRNDKRPKLFDGRDTGAIEEYARLVLAPYRPDYYDKENSMKPGILELHILKQNKGATGMVELDFVPQRCQVNSRLY